MAEKNKTLDAGLVADLAGKVTDNGKAFSKLLNQIKLTSKELHEIVNVAAASCVCMACNNGNVASATQLVEVLQGKGTDGSMHRANALIDWFQAYGPMIWTQEGEGANKKAYFKLDRNKLAKLKPEYQKDKLAFASKLVAYPFWLFKKEQPYEGYDLIAQLRKLVARATKIQEDEDKANHPDTHIEGLDDLKILISKISTNRKVEDTAPANDDNQEDTKEEIAA